MNYLDIIAHGSLVLFATPVPPKPAHHRSFSSDSTTTPPLSPHSAPGTPAILPRPGPVEVSILNLMSSDTDCAYYLLTHVLEHASVFHPNAASLSGEASADPLSGVTKEALAEAEVMAWREVDKGKMFTRNLGEWYATHSQGISEDQLRDLATTWGVEWKGDKGRSPTEDKQLGGRGEHRVSIGVPA